MIENLQHWMLQVITSAFLVALVQQLMPEGTVKQVGNLLGGLILLLVLLKPLADLSGTEWQWQVSGYQERTEAEIQQYLQLQNNQLRQLIEENTAAYIEDKAAEMGIACSAAVQAEEDGNGIPRPVRVTLVGRKEAELVQFIRQQLGIEEEQQIWLEN